MITSDFYRGKGSDDDESVMYVYKLLNPELHRNRMKDRGTGNDMLIVGNSQHEIHTDLWLYRVGEEVNRH